MTVDLRQVLSSATYERLRATAERDNTSIEAMLREAVEWWLSHTDMNKKRAPTQGKTNSFPQENGSPSDIAKLVAYCRANLDLTTQLGEEYSYQHLPLCLVDAIFSIGVTYTATRNTVDRLCLYAGIDKHRRGLSAIRPEFSISDLIRLYRQNTPEIMAKEVYRNHQRTSATSGILKADAVRQAAELMAEFDINTMADAGKIDHADFEAAFCKIPGQKSGISLRYLRMLVGSENEIKPDRMIIRFIAAATGREPKVNECHPLLVKACSVLASEYPNLKPRTLDNLMWQYQSRSR